MFVIQAATVQTVYYGEHLWSPEWWLGTTGLTLGIRFFEAVSRINVVGGRVVLVAQLGVVQGQSHEGLSGLQ